MKKYYETLEVEKTATDAEIKKSYRKLAMKYHPDTNPDDVTAENNFKEINEAYEVLSDETKKSNYDTFGDPDGRPTPHTSQHGFGGGFQSATDFNDIFNDIMNARSAPKNAHAQSQMTITLEEAYVGSSVEIEITNHKNISSKQNIRIPAGIKHGMTLRLAGAGHHHIEELPPGDLLVNIQITPHSIFTVVDYNLIMEEKISMIEAVFGKEIEVTTLAGKTLKLEIPKGTQPNHKIRLKGKGMPVLNRKDVFGDLYIIVNVEIPTNITQKQRDLLSEFNEVS